MRSGFIHLCDLGQGVVTLGLSFLIYKTDSWTWFSKIFSSSKSTETSVLPFHGHSAIRTY